MPSSTIILEISGAIARITLNRPQVFNSFNREMALALQEALDQCASDEQVRAIYLSGDGKAFCAGQDLGEAVDPAGPDARRMVEEHYNPIIRRLRAIEKPIVCAVNGVAAGAGANIALACDVVVAKQSALFVQAFSSIGLIPDSGGTFMLPRLIGWQKAAALMMLADKVGAEEAERMGMIYRCFPDEEFEIEAWKIAEKLAAMPTLGLGYTKRLLNLSVHNHLEQQLEAERDVQVLASQSNDFREGVAAFLEKRKPVFTGK